MIFYIAPIKWFFPGSRLPIFFRQREGEDVDRWVVCLLLSMLCRCMLCRPSFVLVLLLHDENYMCYYCSAIMLLYHALYAFASDASFKMSILQWRALVFGKKLVGLGSRERAHPPRHVLGNILCPQDAPMIPLHDRDINTNTDTHTYKHKYKHKYKL